MKRFKKINRRNKSQKRNRSRSKRRSRSRIENRSRSNSRRRPQISFSDNEEQSVESNLPETGIYVEQIKIQNGDVGFSYERVFKKYLDETVRKVEIEDPYIRNKTQTYNFLAFCEVLVRYCPNLNYVHLTTGKNPSSGSSSAPFEDIKRSIGEFNVVLIVNYSSTLHDREIRIDNGYTIKIGRGLDYFQNIQEFELGFFDQNLRQCRETTIDIFFKKPSDN